MKKKMKPIAFKNIKIGEYFYLGVGFHIKRSETTADYHGITVKQNRTGDTHSPDQIVFVENK